MAMFEFLRNRKTGLATLTVALVVLSVAVSGVVFASSMTGGNHDPINIQSDNDFTTIGSTSGCSCVSFGKGTQAEPFLIGPWTIMATRNSPGVLIRGVTKNFILLHITVHGGNTNDGIELVNLNALGPHGEHFDVVRAANIDRAANGVLLRNASGVTVSGDSVNNNLLWGVKLENSNHDKVTFMTVAHNGLANPDSTELPDSRDAFLEKEFAGGVLFKDSDYNELSRSQLSEDAFAGFVLVNSNHNTVADVHSRYPDYYGGVLQDSSFNRIDKIDMQTADFIGMAVRGGGHNNITNSDFSANGPIGNEVNAGVVPYFISGLYLGWGTHDNRITFDHSNSGNTGPGLLVDNERVVNPIQKPFQGMNPLNNAAGNDPGTVPTDSAFDAGVSTSAGSGNVYCGNFFADSNLSTNPNAMC